MNQREYVAFLVPTFICVVTSQATMVVDASVGGNLLGTDAVLAVNLAMPMYEMFYELVTLLGTGACTAASLALGRGDVGEVRRRFTGAVLSSFAVMLTLCVAIHAFTDTLTDLLCGDSYLKTLTHRYLHAMVPYFLVSAVQIIVMMFTAMAGHPMLVMFCSLMQFTLNLSCNIILIEKAGLGVEALAYYSFISSACTLIVLIQIYVNNNCHFITMRCQ